MSLCQNTSHFIPKKENTSKHNILAHNPCEAQAEIKISNIKIM